MYVRNKPTGAMKEYVDWILSDEGQKIVNEVGYFPIR
jgi:phosphate transport system substrate-binding protein